MNRGRYIVLEGPEGAGKTTQLHELARRLRSAGFPVRVLREPDSQSDLTARAIRQLTQDPQYPMNTRTEVLLYNAARAQSLQVIKQSVENGIICLVDRNYLTTLAIQYYGRGDVPDYNTINNIINFAVGDVEPDLCMVLDAPVNTLRQRLSGRNAGERFDNLDDNFLERVRAGYLWEARQRGLQVVFATEEPEVVADSIWKLVATNLSLRNAAPDQGPVSVKEVIEQKQAVTSETAVEAEAATITETASAKSAVSILTEYPVSGLLAAYLGSNRFGETVESVPYGNGAVSYYIPKSLNESVTRQYQQAMDTIIDIHSTIMGKLEDHLTNASSVGQEERDKVWQDNIRQQANQTAAFALPLACISSLQIEANDHALTTLLSDSLPEAREIVENIIKSDGASIASPDAISDVASYRTGTYKAVSQLAEELLPSNNAAQNRPVLLVDYWPKNELLLVPDMLYEHSSLPLEQLQSIANDWPYDQKTKVFKTYMGDRQQPMQYPGRALEKAHYSWDLLCDYDSLRSFQKHKAVDDFNWQMFTPRYGYEIPSLVEEAGLAEQFEACFDISLKLFSLLQREGHVLEAQYAVLRGHKLRCKLTYNAREAFRIHESTHAVTDMTESYQTLIKNMHEKLAEVHPLLGESMIFA